MHGPQDLPTLERETLALTRDEVKRRHYRDDVYFRETLVDLAALPVRTRRQVLTTATFTLFKPEALAGRRAAPALEFLRAHDFEPTGCLPVSVDRAMMRTLWWYQLNAASLTVVRIMDMVIAAGPFVFVALRDLRDGQAARRLSDLKGSSAGQAGAGSWRQALRTDTMCLNFVHVPDEPPDVVRELGVLFSGPARRTALRLLGQGSTVDGYADTARALQAEQSRCPEHPLDLGRSMAALDATRVEDPRRDEVLRLLSDGSAGVPETKLLALIEWLDGADVPLARWDRIVLAAYLVGDTRPARLPLIGPPAGPRAAHRRALALGQPAAEGATNAWSGSRRMP